MTARPVLRPLALLVAVLLPVLGAAPAFAGWDPPAPPPPTSTSAPADSDQVQGEYSGCSVVSGPAYIGLSCPGKGNGSGRTVKEILAGDPIPDCWHDPISAQELDAMHQHNEPGPDGWTWYWYRCLKGAHPDMVVPGSMHILSRPVQLFHPAQPETLTQHQQELVQAAENHDTVPPPQPMVSPSAHPRVGQWVAFWNLNAGERTIVAGDVVLRARVVGTTVEPLGHDIPPKIDCDGNGTRVGRNARPVEGDGICWYKYTRSSAGQPNNEYPVVMTSHWLVELSTTGNPGTWTEFDRFDKSTVTPYPVTEIQTLVVR